MVPLIRNVQVPGVIRNMQEDCDDYTTLINQQIKLRE